MPRGERKGALLNYTTKVPAEKTISRIEILLARSGANAILKEYDGGHNIVAISFRINTTDGMVPFKLPLNLLMVQQVLKNQHREGKIGQKFTELEQAARVGWRIILNWIEAQMAIIETRMVTVEQVFLPYIVVGEKGETLYDKYLKNRSDYMLPEITDTKDTTASSGATPGR